MKRMLINATQEEELRMAMVDGQNLYDLNIELPSGERKKANIYKGKITRVEPSLEAAFVDYGSDRHGFLPLKEISSEYFVKEVASGSKPNIREVLKEGQDIVVQIDKEERGNKGAALTTYVSLAGRFIVLKPNKQKSGGVSRRIVGQDRDLARESLKGVDIPDGMSVILRTAGIDRDSEELEWDLNNLLAIWEAIKSVVLSRPTPFLIYRESNAIVRALRDYLTNEVGEILIDDETTYKEASEFVEQVMPHNQRKLKLYQDPVPLFTRYQIESQIESAFAHNVNLPSGGSIVIDHTEALVAIDINSARATKGSDIEETAYKTNLEAAEEIGRQLRLRDLGGLIVIDFIDMGPQKNQRAVETRLRDAVRQDRARVQFGKISRFGLLEMSRQRLRPSLGESSNLICPRCTGIGNIRSVESLALAILRLIGEEARKERTSKVIAQLPVEVATYLLNEKREWVQSLEARHEMQVILIANPLLETPHYQVRRVRDDQLDLSENIGTSYALIEEEEQVIPQAIQRKPTELAAVATVAATTPPPERKQVVEQKPGLLARIAGLFSGDQETEDEEKRSAGRKQKKRSDGRSRGGQRSQRRGQSQKSGDGRKTPRKKQASKKAARKTDGQEPRRKTKARSGDARSTDEQKDETSQQTASPTTADESGTEPRKSSRRRSRGGRRRRRGGQGKTSAETQADDAQSSTDVTESEATEKASSTPKPAPDATPKFDEAVTAKTEEKTKASKPKPAQDTSAIPDEKEKAKAEEKTATSEPKPARDTSEKPAAAVEPKAEEKTETRKPKSAQDASEKPAVAVKAKAEDEPKANEPKKEVRETTGASPRRSPAPAATAEKSAEENRPKRAAKKPQAKTKDRDADYEDTQPSLPILKQPQEEKAAANDKPAKVVGEKKSTVKPGSATSTGNGVPPVADEKNSAETPKMETKKPAGRLLPWEPEEAPSKQVPDKDSSA